MCDEYLSSNNKSYNLHDHDTNVARRSNANNNNYCETSLSPSSSSHQRQCNKSCNCEEQRGRYYPNNINSSVCVTHGMMYPNEETYQQSLAHRMVDHNGGGAGKVEATSNSTYYTHHSRHQQPSQQHRYHHQYYHYSNNSYNNANNNQYIDNQDYENYYNATSEYYNNTTSNNYPPHQNRHYHHYPNTSDVSSNALRTTTTSPSIHVMEQKQKDNNYYYYHDGQEEYNQPSLYRSSSPLVISTSTTQEEDEEIAIVANSSKSFNSSNGSLTCHKTASITKENINKRSITTGLQRDASGSIRSDTIRSEIENDLKNIKAFNNHSSNSDVLSEALLLPSSTQINNNQDAEKSKKSLSDNKDIEVSPKNISKKSNKKNKMYSNYIGVTFNKTHGKYQACITHYRKQHYLGRYKLSSDAALAYDKGAKLLKGHGWKINFCSDDQYWAARCKEEQEKLMLQNASSTSTSSTSKHNTHHVTSSTINTDYTNALLSSPHNNKENIITNTNNDQSSFSNHYAKNIITDCNNAMQKVNLVSPHNNNNKRTASYITPSSSLSQPSSTTINLCPPTITHDKKIKSYSEQPNVMLASTTPSSSHIVKKLITKNETPSYVLNNMLEAASALMTLNNVKSPP